MKTQSITNGLGHRSFNRNRWVLRASMYCLASILAIGSTGCLDMFIFGIDQAAKHQHRQEELRRMDEQSRQMQEMRQDMNRMIQQQPSYASAPPSATEKTHSTNTTSGFPTSTDPSVSQQEAIEVTSTDSE